ncbi:MAG: hypothetical protein KGQ66_17995 [Acidobacteriota bacterium]|nr:hypothetical protein [Acidobacteriota bacterium]
MQFSRKWRLTAFAGALAGSAALVAAASGTTGAYFNDTHSGTVTGNIGSIKVVTSGGGGTDNLDFNFANMLPGVYQTATVGYTNTGVNNEDVYLVFNNAQALHAVNNLGSYGAAKILSNGTEVFSSTNLDDGEMANLSSIDPTTSHCSNSSVAMVPLSPTGCWPIPNVIKLASNVAPGHGGNMQFSFALGAKLKSEAAELAQFFCYPLIQNPSDPSNPTDQVCNTSNPSYGLPYQIVATQPGIAPNDPNNTTPTP